MGGGDKCKRESFFGSGVKISGRCCLEREFRVDNQTVKTRRKNTGEQRRTRRCERAGRNWWHRTPSPNLSPQCGEMNLSAVWDSYLILCVPLTHRDASPASCRLTTWHCHLLALWTYPCRITQIESRAWETCQLVFTSQGLHKCSKRKSNKWCAMHSSHPFFWKLKCFKFKIHNQASENRDKKLNTFLEDEIWVFSYFLMSLKLINVAEVIWH